MKQYYIRHISVWILGFTIYALSFQTSLKLLRGNTLKSTETAMTSPSPNLIRAPEFPANFTWLNTDKPLSLRALRGKIVLLDFWTYGCINCMHVLPDLAKLERKYDQDLVVISVHSAKFANENGSQNIHNAMLRYNITHPVLVDENMKVWDAYAINAWPTFVLVDPTGRIEGSITGEGNYNVLDKTIANMVRHFGAQGQLNATPVRFALDAAKVPNTPLWYPGKVLADATTNRLFIADSNHNRIVISDLRGQVEAVAGSGVAGLQDGAFDAATFRNPQGMALRHTPAGGLILYVADTNNHAIRALDLRKGTVTTLAGTGQQADLKVTAGLAAHVALSSPWDLQVVENTLYIAMAGPHQIWALDLNSQQLAPYAGAGGEARVDGELRDAVLAQPSGLTTDGKSLFFADSESSSIRAASLPGNGTEVKTLAGGGEPGRNLFQFGDVDGSGEPVRFQHPLGVAYNAGTLYVADTYNHKIKTIDLATGRVQTFLGSARGDGDGAQPQFCEPGGLSASGHKLYIADTNNHKIKVVDLATRQVTTLTFKNLPTAQPADPARPVRPAAPDDIITLPVTHLAPNAHGELVLDVKLPAQHEINEEAPFSLQAQVEGTGLQVAKLKINPAQLKLPLHIPFIAGPAGTQGTAVVSTTIYYCTQDKGLCKARSLRFRAPFTVQNGGAVKLTLRAQL